MSMLRDIITNFLEEMADFGGDRDRKKGVRRRGPVPVRLYSREESDAKSRWESDGGRSRHRRERFDFFDD